MHEVFCLPAMAELWNQVDKTWGKSLPENSIFHYTNSVLAVKNILSEGELWLSKSTVMNDYSEIVYGIELVRKMFIELVDGNTELLHIANSFCENAASNFSDYYIISFSQNGNSRLLWDSYSNKNGYNIEFSKELISDFIDRKPYIVKTFAGSKFVDKQEGKCIFIKTYDDEFTLPSFSYEVLASPVLYDADKQRELLREVVEYTKAKQTDGKITDIQLAFNALMQSLPFLKDSSLREEEEYRLVIKITPGREDGRGKKQYLRNVQQYREKDNMLFPYIILKMKSRTYIKSVSLGYTNCNTLSKQTMEDFVSTLSQDIEIKTPNYALRW